MPEGQPVLIVIRGNSGSGKSTIAHELRMRFGRGCAVVGQDHIRRTLLREHESVTAPITPELIRLNARFALDHGYHTIVEGILDAPRYGPMLRALLDEHPGDRYAYYLDISFAETVRRHATRPQTAEFTPAVMEPLYRRRDLLEVPGEIVIGESSSLAETVNAIFTGSGLASDPR